MLLWLDDRRDPAEYGCQGWTWAKTAEQAIALLATGQVQGASLDHDLGPDLDGHDVILWMEENDGWPPHGVFVHSSNTSAGDKMRLAVDRRYPDLAAFRGPYMTPLEQGVQANYLLRRSLETNQGTGGS